MAGSQEIAIKLKVCGMKMKQNLDEIADLAPDFLGFIFYENSPRYMANSLKPENLGLLPRNIKKVGVFVNASLEFVQATSSKYNFDFVQLHGHESVAYCQELKTNGHNIIKVFHVGEEVNWGALAPYQPLVDYFLFDTKSKQYGGTGNTFNWKILSGYKLSTPFFLSGGIDLINLNEITDLSPKPYAIDVNSKFESAPGVKDVDAIRQLQLIMKQKLTINRR